MIGRWSVALAGQLAKQISKNLTQSDWDRIASDWIGANAEDNSPQEDGDAQ